MESCDVLVVGAGPTGTVAATWLARAGVDVRIVDQAPGRLPWSRALAIQPRTLELLDRLDAADAMVDAGVPVRATNVYVDGARVIRFAFGEVAAGITPFPFVLFLSQARTEVILDDALRASGARVERPWALVGLSQDDRGVTAQLGGPDGARELRCRWLIGADGAHSAVRHALELPFEGDAYRSDFVLGDARVGGVDGPLDEVHVYLGRSGLCALFPIEDGVTRVIATQTSKGEEGALPVDELQATARTLSGHPLTLDDPTWLARFHLHHRGVPRYRVGRCFVAGDAAHIHSPAGGQGMNTGIQDAINLAWKLAAVLRDGVPEALLDSYNDERWPVGRRLLQFTDRAFTLGAMENPIATGVRNFLAPYVVPRVAELGGPARAFRFVSQIGIRYRGSSVGTDDLEGADAAFRAGPRAGDRAPGPFVRSLDGIGWWVLGFCGVGDAACDGERWERLLDAACDGVPDVRVRRVDAAADPDGSVHGTYGLTGPGVVVVRPDGHVAFRSKGRRVDPLVRWWDRFLGRGAG